jgi:hypothetical protein
MAKAVREFGRVDAVLNVAGIGGAGVSSPTSPWRITTGRWTSIFAECFWE